MKKREIIKSSREYTEVINSGNKVISKNFSVYYRESPEKNRYGISVPKKTGKAVIRNKIKRRVKNIIDSDKNSMQKTYDYVIIVRKGILDLTYLEMKRELLNLINSIGDKN